MWPRAPHPLPKPRPLSTDTALWSRVAAMAGRQGALASADSAHGIIECDHHFTIPIVTLAPPTSVEPP